ncbi:MAG: transglycosylase SLT domain-containing protein [Acidobacteria bacterium]|nr:transglycosylase SLT domain-containing protein [Acidobacteriota bacterium]
MKRTVFAAFLTMILLVSISFGQSDSDLRITIEKDKGSRDPQGKLLTLPAAEHIARANIYLDNRHFPEAREHAQVVLQNYPNDPAVARALFVMGRAFMWEREYAKAIPYFDRVSKEYPDTKDGREALSFDGACHVRLGQNAEAAKLYEQYTVMYPTGERIDGAYLNIIDALREARDYDAADAWVIKTQDRFAGTPTAVNALHARLRMQIFRGRWNDAIVTSQTLSAMTAFKGSMTSLDEVKYLGAFALERVGRRDEAMSQFASIANNATYFGGLASDRIGDAAGVRRTALVNSANLADYPAAFKTEVLASARAHKLDPRFVLAIMKQESTFRPGVKSPSAARGLLQLVYDTALKYNKAAGYPNLQPDDLYNPAINVAIGCEYLAFLRDQFGGLYEAIAASYNGGEDNAGRWLARSKPKEPAIFAAEVGFAETKNYVFKVMTGYRIYKSLYDENLNRR